MKFHLKIFFFLVLVSEALADGKNCQNALKAAVPSSLTDEGQRVVQLLNRPIPLKTLQKYGKKWDRLDKELEKNPIDISAFFSKPSGIYRKVNEKRMSPSSTIQIENKEKSRKEEQALKNWEEANTLVGKWIEAGEPLTLDKVLQINAIIQKGVWGSKKYGGLRVREMTHNLRFDYVPVKDVKHMMREFFNWYEKNDGRLHPVQLAGHAYQFLVSIHPFDNGNGRTTRLVMDYILMSHGYPPGISLGYNSWNLALYAALPKGKNFSSERAIEVSTSGVENTLKVLRGEIE